MQTMSLVMAVFSGAMALGCQSAPVPSAQAPTPPPQGSPPSPADTGELSDLLGYYRRSAKLGDGELSERLQALKSELKPGHCTPARIKSAMLVSRLPANHEAAQVEGLLEPCTTDTLARYTEQGELASLLQAMLHQREQRVKLQDRAAALDRELEDAHDENQRVRKQLDGLKAIERSIQERERQQSDGE